MNSLIHHTQLAYIINLFGLRVRRFRQYFPLCIPCLPELNNHRITEWLKQPLGSSWSNPLLLKQGHLEEVAQDDVQLASK